MENSGIQHLNQIPFHQKLICFHAGGQVDFLCLSQEEGVGRGPGAQHGSRLRGRAAKEGFVFT